MATHSNILAWRIPWTEEPGGLRSMGSQESNTTQRLNHHVFKNCRRLEEGLCSVKKAAFKLEYQEKTLFQVKQKSRSKDELRQSMTFIQLGWSSGCIERCSKESSGSRCTLNVQIDLKKNAGVRFPALPKYFSDSEKVI